MCRAAMPRGGPTAQLQRIQPARITLTGLHIDRTAICSFALKGHEDGPDRLYARHRSPGASAREEELPSRTTRIDKRTCQARP